MWDDQTSEGYSNDEKGCRQGASTGLLVGCLTGRCFKIDRATGKKIKGYVLHKARDSGKILEPAKWEIVLSVQAVAWSARFGEGVLPIDLLHLKTCGDQQIDVGLLKDKPR